MSRLDRVQKFLPSSSDESSDDERIQEGVEVTQVVSFNSDQSDHSDHSDKVKGSGDNIPVISSKHVPSKHVPRKHKPRKNIPSKNIPDTVEPVSETKLMGLFTMDKMAYDVILDGDTLTMNLMEGQVKSVGERKKSLSKQNSKSDLLSAETISLSLKDIYAVNMVRTPFNQRRQSSDNITTPVLSKCQGIMILTYERKEGACKCVERVIFLKHPSEVICSQWIDKIKSVLEGYTERPRKLLVLLQVCSGRKMARDIYHEKVKSVIMPAGCQAEVIELDHQDHIMQIVTNFDLDQYDCILVMGGDGTVKTVLHHLLCRTQADNHISQNVNFIPVPCRLPVGIVPCGTTNTIVTTIHGTDDVYTAVLHIVLGHSVRVDMCSIFSNEKFRRWAFTAQYGFYGNVLNFTDNSKVMPSRILDQAYGKALAKSTLRDYDCDVHYVPVTERSAGNPMDGSSCRSGCDVCAAAASSDANGRRRRHDDSDDDDDDDDDNQVMPFDPLANSACSNDFSEMKLDDVQSSNDDGSGLKMLKGKFLSVGIYCNAAMCDQAPQGLSKYTHCADGTMDLICIKYTSRRDFIRHLKRCGNSKNQLDFPFVQTFRVSEVCFHRRTDVTWQHRDPSYNEIEYRTDAKKASRSRNDDIKVIQDSSDDDEANNDDDDEDGARYSYSRNRGSKPRLSVDVGDMSRGPDGHDNGNVEFTNEKPKTAKKSRLKIFSREGSLLDLAKRSSKADKETSDRMSRRMSEPQNRPSLLETETKTRIMKRDKKEKKLKEKDENHARGIWNIDGDLDYETDLHFRIHPRIVTLCGFGIHRDADLGDCKFHYLPVV